MAKSKKHVLSVEVYKYPYCGRLDDTKITYQKKFVVILLEPGKKLSKKRNG
jgi:hypothetical protein